MFIFGVMSFSNITNSDWNFNHFFNTLSIYSFFEWFEIFIMYICNVIINGSILTIIQKLTPQHVGIGNSLSSIFVMFIYTKGNWYMIIIKSILFIIVLIVSLIYTEIIVLNIFSLGDYTRYEIDKRGSRETQKIEKQLSSSIMEDEVVEEMDIE